MEKKIGGPGKPRKNLREKLCFFCRVFSEKCQNPKAQLPPKKQNTKSGQLPTKKTQQKTQKKNTTFRLKEHSFPVKNFATAIRKKKTKNTCLIIYCKCTIFKTKKHTKNAQLPTKKIHHKKHKKNTTFRLKT